MTDTFRAMCPECALLTVVRVEQGMKCTNCGWKAGKPAGTSYCGEAGRRQSPTAKPAPAGSKGERDMTEARDKEIKVMLNHRFYTAMELLGIAINLKGKCWVLDSLNKIEDMRI